jgi:hypothetical protein
MLTTKTCSFCTCSYVAVVVVDSFAGVGVGDDLFSFGYDGRSSVIFFFFLFFIFCLLLFISGVVEEAMKLQEIESSLLVMKYMCLLMLTL